MASNALAASIRRADAWLCALAFTLAETGCGELRETRVIGTDTTDAQLVEVEFEVDLGTTSELPPDFGNVCNVNDDCSTGFCVEGPSGFVCSKTCISECPAGWGCKGIQSGSSDIKFVCVPDGAPDRDTTGEDGSDATPTDTSGPTPDTTETTDATTDTGPTPDTSEPPSGTACDAPPGTTNDRLRGEAQVLSGDYPDCVVGCDLEVNPTLWLIDLATGEYTGAAGKLDGNDHVYSFESGDETGPDTDVVAIVAPPRSMLEIAVLKDAPTAATEPVVYVSDGFQVRTYNSDVSATNTCARTTIGFPWVSSLPIYVVVEDAINYDRWTPTGFSPGTVGGPNYGWHMRIRSRPFAPVDLGNFTSLQIINRRGEQLQVGGETRYFRFYAPGTSKPRVTLTRTSSGAFDPVLAGMKTIAGELAWQRVITDDDGDGTVRLPTAGFRPCIPQSECPSGFTCPPNLCSADDAEFIFAVLDYNGNGAPAGFSYDLEIVIE
jgi:hypothetical protein